MLNKKGNRDQHRLNVSQIIHRPFKMYHQVIDLEVTNYLVPRKMPKELAKEPDAPTAKLSPADCHGPLTTGTPTGIAHTTPPYGLS